MPLANVVVPLYPAVPSAPGVPPLARLGQIVETASLLISDAADLSRVFQGPQWGIFDQTGAAVIIGDTVVSIDYRKEYRVSGFPVELGAFAAYNKVATPFDIRVCFAVSGKDSLISSLLSGGALGAIISGNDPDAANRAAFLTAMEAAINSLYLFTVVTPEATYPNVNIVHYDYRREARRGKSLITVEVWCQQIRLAAQPAFSGSGTTSIDSSPAACTAPQNPASADASSQGTVQAMPITPASSAGAASAPGTVPSTVRFIEPDEAGYNPNTGGMTNLSRADYAAMFAN